MLQAVTALLTVLGASLPILIWLMSTPRRRLSLIRDEARTRDALKDHPAREELDVRITASVERYRVYMVWEPARAHTLAAVGWTVTAVAFLAVTMLLNRPNGAPLILDVQMKVIIGFLLLSTLTALVNTLLASRRAAREAKKINDVDEKRKSALGSSPQESSEVDGSGV